jgi:hypothetical protein
MSVALRPSVRLFALVPALVALGSIVVDFMLLEFYGVAFLLMVSLLVYVGVGLLLVQRLPRQPVGWLLLGAGALLQMATAGGAYGWAAFIRAPGTLPLGEVALVLSWGWLPALGCLFTAVMLFPTGRPPSPRWRPAVALVVITTALLLVAALFSQQDIQVPQSLGAQNAPPLKVPNPLAIDGPLATLLAYGYASPFTFFVYLIPVAAVLARFRTAVGNERQQLKWFAFASSLGMSFFVVSGLVPTLFSYLSDLGPAIAIIAIDLIPISVAIAILRYRLYDIDLLIKRTLVYGATTAAIAATFWLGILALQRLLSPVTSGSEVAIAASTLASLALFQPVRRRVQNAVDRRFDRSRYNAARTVDAFADVLREEVDLDEVRADLLGSVQQTMAPAHASLWLREGAR